MLKFSEFMFCLRLFVCSMVVYFITFSGYAQTYVFAELSGTPTLNTAGWNLNGNAINNYYKNLQNKNIPLYWLNIHLSKTNINLFNEYNKYYQIFKIKRDQIFIPKIIDEKKLNVNKIIIKCTNGDSYVDGDYGFIKNYSEMFNRPLGGMHL